jgi:acyl-CoA thioester hydrolase
MGLEGILKTTVRVTVPYHDADPGGVAWHGNYFRYFDTARCALLDLFDYGYREMVDSGYMWPIIDTGVRFVHPVRYDDQIEVEALLAESEYRLKIKYVIRDLTGRTVTKGHTIQVAVDAATGELCIGSPAALLDRLAALEKRGIPEPVIYDHD